MAIEISQDVIKAAANLAGDIVTALAEKAAQGIDPQVGVPEVAQEFGLTKEEITHYIALRLMGRNVGSQSVFIVGDIDPADATMMVYRGLSRNKDFIEFVEKHDIPLGIAFTLNAVYEQLVRESEKTVH